MIRGHHEGSVTANSPALRGFRASAKTAERIEGTRVRLHKPAGILGESLRKLKLAASRRSLARTQLEDASSTLVQDEQRRLEGVLHRENRQIEMCAKAINDALRTAASQRRSIAPMDAKWAANDPELSGFLRTMNETIERLNAQSQPDQFTSARAADEAASRQQLQAAARMEERCQRTLRDLEAEMRDLDRCERQSQRELAERQRHVDEIKHRLRAHAGEVKQTESELGRFRTQDSRQAQLQGRLQRELGTLEQRSKQFARTSKAEVDPKDQARMDHLKGKIDELTHFRTHELGYRVKQLEDYVDRLKQEQAHLERSLVNAETDLSSMENEAKSLSESRKACEDRMGVERKQLTEVRAAKSALAEAGGGA